MATLTRRRPMTRGAKALLDTLELMSSPDRQWLRTFAKGPRPGGKLIADMMQRGWFEATAGELKNRTGMASATQARRLQELIGLRKIEMCRLGLPSTRWIRLLK